MKKRILAIFMCVCISMASFGCGDTEEPRELETVVLTPRISMPVYKDAEEYEFMIGGWNTPSISDASLRLTAEAGINRMNLTNMSFEAMLEAFKYGSKYGVQCWPQMGKRPMKPQEFSQKLFGDGQTYEGLGGFNYYDEPDNTLFQYFGTLADNHHLTYRDLEFFVNLYPVNFYKQNPNTTSPDYMSYVMEYCNSVLTKVDKKILSVDHYPLMFKAGNPTSYWLQKDWLETVETISICAKAYGALAHYYLLTTGHYDEYRVQTQESLRYQANVYLAYGARGLSHFTTYGYPSSDPKWDDDLPPIDNDKKVEPLYTYVQTVNNEIHDWEHVILQFDWEGVYYSLGATNASNELFDKTKYGLEKIDVLKSCLTTQDTIIGSFNDGEGNPGLMITNFSDPVLKLTDEVILELYDANKALIYQNGVMSVVDVEDGVLTLSLGAGDAAFVIPVLLTEK